MAFPPIFTRKKQFTGNGLKGPFVFDKYLLSASELTVIKTVGGVDTPLVLNTDYTVTLVKKSNGIGYLSASITLVDELNDSETLTIEARLNYTQTLDLVNGTVLDLDSFESVLDRSALMSAQLSGQLQSTIKIPASSSINTTNIQSFGPSKYLRVNSTVTSIEAVNPVDLILEATLATTNGNFLVGGGSAWLSSTPTDTRTALGLGSIALQASTSVTFTGGNITGITPLSVLDGGTGAGTISGAQSNLGLVPGLNIQTYSSELASLASYNTNGILVRTGSGTYVGRSLAASTGLTMTNGSGVAGSPTLSYNISGLTEETSPLITDTVLIQKSDGSINKVQIQNLPSYNTSGAPADSTFLTITSSGSTTAERTATAGTGVSLTDGGANSNLTVAVNINGLSVDSSPDLLNDYIMTYDASASGLKKTILNNIKGWNGTHKLLLSQSFSGVTSVNFSSTYITSTYSAYVLVATNIVDSGSSWTGAISLSSTNGSGFATNYRGTYLTTNSSNTTLTNTASAGVCRLFGSPTLNDAVTNATGYAVIFAPSSATPTIIYDNSIRFGGTTNVTESNSSGAPILSGTFNYLSVSVPSTSTGRITLYGIL